MTESGELIQFPTGQTAVATRVARDAGAESLFHALQVPEPRATVILHGTTAALAPEVERRVEGLIRRGLATVAVEDGVTVLTGATDAGILAILGSALDGHDAPLVGVAPIDLVTWPGRHDEGPEPFALTPLEPHHSHFVLVDGDEWGDETAALIELAKAMNARGPAVAVLLGGGSIARAEALALVEAGLRVVVVAGSGRLANAMAAAAEDPGRYTDPDLIRLADSGRVTIFPATGGPAEFAAVLRAALGMAPR